MAKACAACHDFTKGGANKTGPALYDVVERPVAAHEGFAYSDGAKAKAAEKWTYDNLNAFLKAPKKFMPGTKMAFGGIGNDKKRADLIAYLGFACLMRQSPSRRPDLSDKISTMKHRHP